MSEGINTHWLMNYRVVALVNQSRRLIRDEFGKRLSLTDPALRRVLEDYAGRSQSRELRRLLGEINREAGAPEPEPPAPESRPASKRMYRGQPLPDPKPPSSSPSSGAPDEPEASKTLIYRGRRVRQG